MAPADKVDQITGDFIGAFGELTLEELNWKPEPNTWSVAQNIDHLIKINNTYYPIINSIRAEEYSVPFWGRFGFVVSFFGRTLLRSVQPETKTRVKTFSIWEPATSDIPDGILERFADHQNKLKALIEGSQDLIADGTVISSPANKNIVYSLETAFEIIVTHELRHLEQAKGVLRHLKEGG